MFSVYKLNRYACNLHLNEQRHKNLSLTWHFIRVYLEGKLYIVTEKKNKKTKQNKKKKKKTPLRGCLCFFRTLSAIFHEYFVLLLCIFWFFTVLKPRMLGSLCYNHILVIFTLSYHIVCIPSWFVVLLMVFFFFFFFSFPILKWKNFLII